MDQVRGGRRPPPIRLHTVKPYPLVEEMLAFGNFEMVPPKYMREKGDAHFALNPVGTGRYRFVEWKKGDRLVLEANEQYWAGALTPAGGSRNIRRTARPRPSFRCCGWRRSPLGGRPSRRHYVDYPHGVNEGAVSTPTFTTRQFNAAITWAELDWFRSLWPGPLLVKGIMSVEDARRAVEHGAEAIVVSNPRGSPGRLSPQGGRGAARDRRRRRRPGRGDPRRRRPARHRRGQGGRAGSPRLHDRTAFNYGLAAAGEAGVEQALASLNRQTCGR